MISFLEERPMYQTESKCNISQCEITVCHVKADGSQDQLLTYIYALQLIIQSKQNDNIASNTETNSTEALYAQHLHVLLFSLHQC